MLSKDILFFFLLLFHKISLQIFFSNANIYFLFLQWDPSSESYAASTMKYKKKDDIPQYKLNITTVY